MGKLSTLFLLPLFVVAPVFAAPPITRLSATPRVGEIAPAIVGNRIQGQDPIDLSRLRGRVVVLDFWATWCRPCQTVMPVLDDLHRAHYGQGLSIVGLTAEAQPVVRSHLSRRQVGYTVASNAMPSMLRYGVRGYPMLVVIDRSGKIRHVSQGVSMAEINRLRTIIPRLLNE